ncbi:hypothetical protein AMECASPLE_020020 [Ameca splendens]|uniref:Secreted protein n=1 Tax=Ameca splendens TaxID=208324 RepID=A0ABV0Y3A3_9TELE
MWKFIKLRYLATLLSFRITQREMNAHAVDDACLLPKTGGNARRFSTILSSYYVSRHPNEAPKIITDCGKLHTGPLAAWIVCLFTLPPDSGISKSSTKYTFI